MPPVVYSSSSRGTVWLFRKFVCVCVCVCVCLCVCFVCFCTFWRVRERENDCFSVYACVAVLHLALISEKQERVVEDQFICALLPESDS